MATPPYLPSILLDAVITALAGFIQPFVGAVYDPVAVTGIPIIRGQQNRVPPPITAFVKLQELLESDIETPIFTNSSDPAVQLATITTPTRLDVQVDFYGPSAGDWCKGIKAVYRSPYAPDQFSSGIAPLYCSDGHQIPLVTGEEQYENHWALTASLQYNPDVIVPQQSATVLAVNTFEDLP